MTKKTTIAAYYYPGWHPCPVRDAAFPKGWSEWDLVYGCQPRFDGHVQPRLPLWGRQNESDPVVFQQKLEAASDYGVDAFVFAFYWSRGKRLLQGALDRGYLDSRSGPTKFALMWANRMPRRVMPVKDPAAQVIDPTRLVHTDPADFLEFIKYVAANYFSDSRYFCLDGAKYLSIFDSNFFLRQLDQDRAREAILEVRDWLRANGYGELHLAAIDPTPGFQAELKSIGFDSVTHYVCLPEWKGPFLQDFEEMFRLRQEQWSCYPEQTGLPYFPSVSPGWDANPRAVDYGKERPGRYPWSPIITGSSPEGFRSFLEAAVDFTHGANPDSPLCFISSWNEWSEGHYLEPDQAHGYRWLEAVHRARR